MIVEISSDGERIGYDLRELSKQLPLSVSFLRKEIERGSLIATMFGDRIVILKQDLNTYISSRQKSSDFGLAE